MRKNDKSVTPPYSEMQQVTSYNTDTGVFVTNSFTANLVAGDYVYLIHPVLMGTVNMIVAPSNNVKQQNLIEVNTGAVVLTQVKSITFNGAIGGARITFDLRISTGGVLATAVVYKNGVPVVVNPSAVPSYTEHTDATGTYHTYTQDVAGLESGDSVEIWAMASAGDTAYVRNFEIGYDILSQSGILNAVEAVYFDADNGFAGDEYPIGTAAFPSSDESAVMTMLAARNLSTIISINGTFYLPKAVANIKWIGNSNQGAIDLNGYDITCCSFQNINIIGTTETIESCTNLYNCYIYLTTGRVLGCNNFIYCDIYLDGGIIDLCSDFLYSAIEAPTMQILSSAYYSIFIDTMAGCTANNFQYFYNCLIESILGFSITDGSFFYNCTFFESGAINLIDCFKFQDCIFDMELGTYTGCFDFVECTTINPLILDCTGIADSCAFDFSGSSVTFTNVTDAGAILNISGDNAVTLAASCTAGTINVFGLVYLTNTSGGSTVNDYTVLGSIGTSAASTLDGVYFDSINGAAGTAWPIGSPEHPSNSLADCKTMMAARNVDKLYLAGATGAITFDTNTDVYLVGNENYAITIAAGVTCNFTGDLKCGPLTHHGNALTVSGDMEIGDIINDSLGTISVIGNAKVNGEWNNLGGDVLYIGGDFWINEAFDMDGAAAIMVDGNFTALYVVNGATGGITVGQNLFIRENLTNSNGGQVSVDGDMQVGGTWDNSGGANSTIRGNFEVGGDLVQDAASGGLEVFGNTLLYSYTSAATGLATSLFHGDLTISTIMTCTDSGGVTVDGKCVVSSIANLGGGDLTFNGGLKCNGGFDNTGGDDIGIIGDTFISGTLTLSGTSAALIYGNVEIAGAIANGSSGAITLYGNLQIGSTITNDSAGTITVSGNCYIGGNLSNNNVGSTFTCTGIAVIRGAITNAGTLTYRGIHPEVPINVTVTNPAETDLLDLSAASHHYTLNDFILKCADPGANTITARLYKLVNGAATLVKSSAGITTANYTSYWTLMDLFGIPSVSGDDIRIAVFVNAGGPYAVTGEYRYTDE